MVCSLIRYGSYSIVPCTVARCLLTDRAAAGLVPSLLQTCAVCLDCAGRSVYVGLFPADIHVFAFDADTAKLAPTIVVVSVTAVRALTGIHRLRLTLVVHRVRVCVAADELASQYVPRSVGDVVRMCGRKPCGSIPLVRMGAPYGFESASDPDR